MRKIFKFSGKNERYVDGIIDWGAVRLRDQSRWPSSYHDEFMCLMLAKAYVQGNDDFVRDVSQGLSCLAVTQTSARCLSTNPEKRYSKARIYPANKGQ